MLIATGARWRRDRVGREHLAALPGPGGSPGPGGCRIYTPDDIMAGAVPDGRITIYDDDHYYLGGVLAEKLCRAGCDVSLVTPAAEASVWTHHTLEQQRIQAKLLSLGVAIRPHRRLTALRADALELACTFTDRREDLACDGVVLVTEREPQDALYRALLPVAEAAGIRTLRRIGDCLAPSTIAQAVWDGHRAARELEGEAGDDAPLKLAYTRLESRSLGRSEIQKPL